MGIFRCKMASSDLDINNNQNSRQRISNDHRQKKTANWLSERHVNIKWIYHFAVKLIMSHRLLMFVKYAFFHSKSTVNTIFIHEQIPTVIIFVILFVFVDDDIVLVRHIYHHFIIFGRQKPWENVILYSKSNKANEIFKGDLRVDDRSFDDKFIIYYKKRIYEKPNEICWLECH